MAGWGAVKFRGPKSPALMEGVIKVVSNEKCEDKFKMFRKSESISWRSIYFDIWTFQSKSMTRSCVPGT